MPKPSFKHLSYAQQQELLINLLSQIVTAGDTVPYAQQLVEEILGVVHESATKLVQHTTVH